MPKLEKTDKTILLMTGAINVSGYQVPETKLTNLTERLYQYIYSIEYAIDNYATINYIIFCENTNYKHNYFALQEKARRKGKTLEVIIFDGNYNTIQEKGKGYGEGEIIEHAFVKSEALRNSSYFYKLTGRLIVQNMDKVIASTRSKNAFIFYDELLTNSPHFVQTVLYKVDTGLYKQLLMDAYKEIDDRRNVYLEHVFFERLKSIPIISFRKYPNIIGISGSSGGLYTRSKLGLLRCAIYNKLNAYSNIQRTPYQKFVMCIIKIFGNYLH
jgi:hypothetical protein